jgi:hypothetical protein
MTAHDPSQNKPHKDYPVGYGKPPKSGQFKPGQKANPYGRPKGQPSQEQILLEEAARLVKIKIGDQVAHVTKDRAIIRRLMDMAALGNMTAARIYFEMHSRAQIAMEVAPETATSEQDLAILQAFLDRNQGKALQSSQPRKSKA